MSDREPIKFEAEYYDLTEEFNPNAFGGDTPFRLNITMLLEDIKWRIERESELTPRVGPLQQISGFTLQPDFARLNNGLYDTPSDIPKSDYLTHDFSAAAQYDRLLDISDRFVAAAVAGKTDVATRLVWRNWPAVSINRYMMPEGLLLCINGSVAWV